MTELNFPWEFTSEWAAEKTWKLKIKVHWTEQPLSCGQLSVKKTSWNKNVN